MQHVDNFCFGAWLDLLSICFLRHWVSWQDQSTKAKTSDLGSLKGDLLYDAVAVCMGSFTVTISPDLQL